MRSHQGLTREFAIAAFRRAISSSSAATRSFRFVLAMTYPTVTRPLCTRARPVPPRRKLVDPMQTGAHQV